MVDLMLNLMLNLIATITSIIVLILWFRAFIMPYIERIKERREYKKFKKRICDGEFKPYDSKIIPLPKGFYITGGLDLSDNKVSKTPTLERCVYDSDTNIKKSKKEAKNN